VAGVFLFVSLRCPEHTSKGKQASEPRASLYVPVGQTAQSVFWSAFCTDPYSPAGHIRRSFMRSATILVRTPLRQADALLMKYFAASNPPSDPCNVPFSINSCTMLLVEGHTLHNTNALVVPRTGSTARLNRESVAQSTQTVLALPIVCVSLAHILHAASLTPL